MKGKKYSASIDSLLEGCKNNDRKAQMEVYNRYYKAMYNIALRILNNTAEAEDVMQESFLNAFQKLHSFSGEVSFGAWLKKIVVNRSLDEIKKRKALISLEGIEEPFENTEQEERLSYSELNVEDIKKALYTLPEGYRIVCSLYLIEGYDHEEIAQILDISNATSRTQYHRAKRKLATVLKDLKAVS